MNKASRTGGGWSLTLHSSWTGIALNALGAMLFLGLATYLVIALGVTAVSVVVLVVALGVAIILALDMPLATTFSGDGLERRAVLRQQHLSWDQVSHIRRGRAGIYRIRKQNVSGGLVAWVGRRPYVLTDALESQIEFDELRANLGHDLADEVGIDERLRPVRVRPPTWSYRRQKWRRDQ